ncbi:hypothetical protein LAZ67_2005479 [Cordylochernes scorpioides]|uniref:Uncharacterized protein n=1 Tax=Cordylochernes scorpioides TaxID=51811 RepID=A0ABY6K5Z4_9ARAC|nr:hypothetical protein LAZ67_2005479 [Cordylochernes scorpioides]
MRTWRPHRAVEEGQEIVAMVLNGYLELSMKNSVEVETDPPDEKNDRQKWCIDSGCTAHLTPNLTMMENVIEYKSEINLAEKGKTTQAIANEI